MRDNFSAGERTKLALRAAYICSNPACRVLTVGADLESDKIVDIGVAAHITAASPGGPRYAAAMPSPERKSALRNGIWLCEVCADLVDANAGVAFPEATLRQWRTEHEEWVRGNLNRRIGGDLTATVVDGSHTASGSGTVTGLDIEGPAVLRPGTKVSASGDGDVAGTRIRGIPKKE